MNKNTKRKKDIKKESHIKNTVAIVCAALIIFCVFMFALSLLGAMESGLFLTGVFFFFLVAYPVGSVVSLILSVKCMIKERTRLNIITLIVSIAAILAGGVFFAAVVGFVFME